MKKLICIAAFTAAAALAQVAGVQRIVVCTDAGASDAYTCTPTPAVTAFAQLNPSGGVPVKIRLMVATANTGAATLDIDAGGALAAKTIVKYVGGAAQTLADNDLRPGQAYEIDYDATGDQYRVLSLLGNGGGGGGSSTVGYDSWHCWRGSAGNRGCEFQGGGTVEASQAGGTIPEEITGLTTDGTSGDKVWHYWMAPDASHSNMTIQIFWYSTGTSQVTFTPKRSCVANDGTSAGFTSGSAVNVTPSAANKGYITSLPISACGAGQRVNFAVNTNAVAIRVNSLAIRAH